MPSALVTGASSGIGLATAVSLARAGYDVTATVRTPESGAALREAAEEAGVGLDVALLDVTDAQSVEGVVAAVVARHGGIDVLVNNAGRGRLGTTERVSVDELRATLDVNLVGVWRMTQAVLPHMRAQRSGRIVTVSSIGGLVAQPFNDAYCAAKFAVEGMMESLAPVAAEFGIAVVLVEPGPVATSFVANVDGLASLGDPDDPYLPLLQRYIAATQAAFEDAQTPQDVADVVLEALAAAEPALRYQTSEAVTARASVKLADPSGTATYAAARARLAPS